MKPRTRAFILESRFLPILTFPYRFKIVAKQLLLNFKSSFIWLFRSREFANFTYDLDATNKVYLSNFIANITDLSVEEISGYIEEIEDNEKLMSYIDKRLRQFKRGKEIDEKAFYGRRIGWYALIRASKPEVVVETGTEKGLGSVVIAEALRKNHFGKLITLDIEPSAGLLIGTDYSDLIEQKIGDSLVSIMAIPKIDFFIHDSDHSAEHELAEFNAALNQLTDNAFVLSDNAHVTGELARWSSVHNFRFAYFAERPVNHWYPGAGIGVAYRR